MHCFHLYFYNNHYTDYFIPYYRNKYPQVRLDSGWQEAFSPRLPPARGARALFILISFNHQTARSAAITLRGAGKAYL